MQVATPTRSHSTTSSLPTQAARGGNRSRSKSRIRSPDRTLQEIGNRSRSRSRTRTEPTAVITIKMKKKSTEVENRLTLDGSYPVIKTKSFTRLPPKISRKRSKSKSKFIEKTNKQDQQLSRFKLKSIGLGKRSKILSRKRLDDDEDPEFQENTSPDLSRDVQIQQSDQPNGNKLSTAVNTDSQVDHDGSPLTYLKTQLFSNNGGTQLLTNSKKKDTDAMKPEVTNSEKKATDAVKPVEANTEIGESQSKLYVMPSLIDSMSASFDFNESTDMSTLGDESFHGNTPVESVTVSTLSDGWANKLRSSYNSGSPKIQTETWHFEPERNENGNPSDKLVKGVYYLGEKADVILSKAFPIIKVLPIKKCLS